MLGDEATRRDFKADFHDVNSELFGFNAIRSSLNIEIMC